jgi:hypothetical protein
MKQTAVEWLQSEIDNKDMGEIPMWIYEFIEQAKEMEKEQIIEVFQDSRILSITNNCNSGEQYYKETFKKD